MLLEEGRRNEIKDVRQCYLNVRTVCEESETEGNSSYCTKNTSHMEAFGKKWYKLNPFTEIDLKESMKREDQQDANIRCLLLTSVSTCFGHHYAHLQENKCPVTAFGVLFWFCWIQQNQNNTPNAVTGPLFS